MRVKSFIELSGLRCNRPGSVHGTKGAGVAQGILDLQDCDLGKNDHLRQYCFTRFRIQESPGPAGVAKLGNHQPAGSG